MCPLSQEFAVSFLLVTVGVVRGGSYQPRNEDQSLVIQLKLLLKKVGHLLFYQVSVFKI